MPVFLCYVLYHLCYILYCNQMQLFEFYIIQWTLDKSARTSLAI